MVKNESNLEHALPDLRAGQENSENRVDPPVYYSGCVGSAACVDHRSDSDPE